MEKFNLKKALLVECADRINEKYGALSCVATVKDSYFNMKEIIESHMYTVDRVVEAMEQVGVKPIIMPIRGGTDGARLSFM